MGGGILEDMDACWDELSVGVINCKLDNEDSNYKTLVLITLRVKKKYIIS